MLLMALHKSDCLAALARRKKNAKLKYFLPGKYKLISLYSFATRLAELGLFPGKTFIIISDDILGLKIKINNTVYFLNSSLTSNMVIEKEE